MAPREQSPLQWVEISKIRDGKANAVSLSEGGWWLHRLVPALDEDYVRASFAVGDGPGGDGCGGERGT